MEIFNFKKGQTLYLGIIILFIILAVGLGISNIIVGQFKMMKDIEKSVTALHAADTGIERILYEDNKCRKRIAAIDGCAPNCAEDSDGDTFCDGIINTYSLSSQPIDNGAEYAVDILQPFVFRSQGTFQGVNRAVEVFIPDYRRVFVTSIQFTGDLRTECFNLCGGDVLCLIRCGDDGIKAADEICNILAKTVDPPLPGTYKAWVTGDSVDSSPSSRFSSVTKSSSVPFRRIDEQLVAENFSDLTDGTDIAATININELGNQATEGFVWTNTNQFGQKASDNHCSNWTSSEFTKSGLLGENSATNQNWTNTGVASPCSEKISLYCFQQ